MQTAYSFESDNYGTLYFLHRPNKSTKRGSRGQGAKLQDKRRRVISNEKTLPGGLQASKLQKMPHDLDGEGSADDNENTADQDTEAISHAQETAATQVDVNTATLFTVLGSVIEDAGTAQAGLPSLGTQSFELELDLAFLSPAEVTRLGMVSKSEAKRCRGYSTMIYQELLEERSAIRESIIPSTVPTAPLVTVHNVMAFVALRRGERRCSSPVPGVNGAGICHTRLPFDASIWDRLFTQHLSGKINRCSTCGAVAGDRRSILQYIEDRVCAAIGRAHGPIQLEAARTSGAIKEPQLSASVLARKVESNIVFRDFLMKYCNRVIVLPGPPVLVNLAP